MAKTDRSILLSNDQKMGDFGDPDKLEASISHLADKIDENDNGFNSHKNAAELAHPDKSVKERHYGDGSIPRRAIQPGAVGTTELDPAILNQPTTPFGQQAKIQEHEDRIKEQGFNIRWNALLALNGDWTNAIQNALDNYEHVYIPKGAFPFTSLTVTKFGATISGYGNLYGGSVLEYSGSGIGIKVMGSVGTLNLRNMRLKGVPAVSTDYFNTGSKGIDVTDGNTSINMDKCWIDGFETLINSNYNSFYNKFSDCRFEKAKTCLANFSNNNMEVKGCRFLRFSDAITANGANGPLIVEKNSFEIFNGAIVLSTGTEKGLVIIKNNYVEIYDNTDLPTNFPNKEASGAKPGKFGGNILVSGYFGTLVLKDNELQLGGVFRIVSATAIDVLESTGNNIHLYSSGNNLDRMFVSLSNFKSYHINDRLGKDIGIGTYTRTYSPITFTVDNPFNEKYYYDCIQGKEIFDTTTIHSVTLQNGWANSATTGYGSAKVIPTKVGLHLSGAITGTARTGIVAFTLPANVRPLVQGTTKSFCNLVAYTNFGAGEKVWFRYLYSTGEFRMESSPAGTADISLDGLFIPMQT